MRTVGKRNIRIASERNQKKQPKNEIDFNALQQELNDVIIEGNTQHYRLE